MKVFIKNIYKFDFTPVIFCRFFTIMKITFDLRLYHLCIFQNTTKVNPQLKRHACPTSLCYFRWHNGAM